MAQIHHVYHLRSPRNTPHDETSHVPASKINLCFVDYHAVNDRLTSTAKTQRAIDFRQKILRREECCVVTEDETEDCDAAHIIAVNKCDAVRSHLVRLPVLIF